MVKVICGTKGSGKTKRMLDYANQAQSEGHGSVVFIDDDDKYVFDLNRNIRFINVNDYDIKNASVMQGLIIGLLAGNYDLEVVLLDGLLRILPEKIDELEGFFASLDELAQKNNIDIYIAVSEDPNVVPDYVKKAII